jgi:hypothetical protein
MYGLRRRLRRGPAARSAAVRIEYGQPTRSAITVAGSRGNARSSSRIRGSYASTKDPVGARTYLGGPSLANADFTVFREQPISRAISEIDTPLRLPQPPAAASRSGFGRNRPEARCRGTRNHTARSPRRHRQSGQPDPAADTRRKQVLVVEDWAEIRGPSHRPMSSTAMGRCTAQSALEGHRADMRDVLGPERIPRATGFITLVTRGHPSPVIRHPIYASS